MENLHQSIRKSNTFVIYLFFRKQSELLEEETKQLENKLDYVKKMMEQEKEKRSTMKINKDGTRWRSATT